MAGTPVWRLAQGDALQQLPLPLAYPLTELARETDARIALWGLCEVLEMSFRLAVVLALGALGTRGDLSPEVLRKLNDHLPEPTLGKWRGMAETLSSALVPTGLLAALPRGVRSELVPIYEGSRGVASMETSLGVLRNQFAHGGGIHRDRAPDLARAWGPKLETLIAASEWLSHVALVGGGVDGLRLLRGPDPGGIPWSGPAEVDATIRLQLGRGERVVLVAEGLVAPLWPLLAYGAVTGSDGGASARHALKIYVRRHETRLQMTPLGSDQVAQTFAYGEALDSFVGILGSLVPEGARVPGFEQEMLREARRTVGREADVETLRTHLQALRSGILWLGGPAGIGKSALVSTLVTSFADLPVPERPLAWRFRAGDQRCNRESFLTFLHDRLDDAKHKKKRDSDVRQLLQRVRALLGARPAMLIVVDGLDEIVATDPGFVDEVIGPLQPAGARWLCAGRPGPATAGVLALGAKTLFPDGLPPLTREAVRALLLERLEGAARKIIRSDEEIAGAVVNRFVERVVERAAGFPLYVMYVVGDLLSGRVAPEQVGADLPRDLGTYHAELLGRYAIGTMHQALTPTAAFLAVAHEPLAATELGAALRTRTLARDDASGSALAQQALLALQSLLRSTPKPDGTLGSQLHHASLRDHLCTSAATAEATWTAREHVANLTRAWPAIGPLRGYVARHGVRHLLEQKRVADACVFLGRLLRRSERVTGLSSAKRRALLAETVAAFGDCSAEELARIDGDALVQMTRESNDVRLLRPLSGALVRRSDRSHAEKAIRESLYEDGIGACMGAELAQLVRSESDPDLRELERLALMDGSDLQTAAHYALTQVFGEHPEWLSRNVIEQHALGHPFSHSLVAEPVAADALRGNPVAQLVPDRAFWAPDWPYCRWTIGLIRAASLLLRGEDPRPDLPPDFVDEWKRALEAHRRDRDALLLDPSVRDEPVLRELLEHQLDLVRRRDLLDASAEKIRFHVRARELSLLLLGSPFIHVAELGAHILGELVAASEVPFSVLEAAARSPHPGVRTFVQDALETFEAVAGPDARVPGLHMQLALDPDPHVRGSVADVIRERILRASARRRPGLLADYAASLRALLRSGDIWALTEVRDLVHELRKRGGVDIRELGLDDAPVVLEVPGWLDLDDDGFVDLATAALRGGRL